MLFCDENTAITLPRTIDIDRHCTERGSSSNFVSVVVLKERPNYGLRTKLATVLPWQMGRLKEAAGTCMAEPRLWITFLSTIEETTPLKPLEPLWEEDTPKPVLEVSMPVFCAIGHTEPSHRFPHHTCINIFQAWCKPGPIQTLNTPFFFGRKV